MLLSYKTRAHWLAHFLYIETVHLKYSNVSLFLEWLLVTHKRSFTKKEILYALKIELLLICGLDVDDPFNLGVDEFLQSSFPNAVEAMKHYRIESADNEDL